MNTYFLNLGITKKTYITLILIVGIFFFTILFSSFIINQIPFIAGIDGMNRFDICMRNDISVPEEQFFEIKDIEKIRQIDNVKNVAYSVRTEGLLETENSKINVEIFGTSENYRNFETFNFISGSYFTESSEEGNSKVLVANDKLLEKVFKSKNIIGANVAVNSTNGFQIIGIIKRSNYLSDILSDNNKIKIYMPFSTIKEMNTSIDISNIYVSVMDSTKLYDTKLSVLKVLGLQEKDSNYFRVVRYDNLVKSEKSKFSISLFLITVVLLIPAIYYQAYTILNVLKKEKSQGFRKDVLLKFIMVLFCSIGVICTYLFLINNQIFINFDYIPNNLIDFKQYKEILMKAISESNTSLGNSPTVLEINLLRLKQLLNFIRVFSFLSLLMIGITIRSSLKLHTSRGKALNLILAIATIILISIIVAMGMLLIVFLIIKVSVSLSICYMLMIAVMLGVFLFAIMEKETEHQSVIYKIQN